MSVCDFVSILFCQILVQEVKRDFSFSAFDCIAMGTPFLFVVHEMRSLAKQTVPPFVPSCIPFTIHVRCKCVCVEFLHIPIGSCWVF